MISLLCLIIGGCSNSQSNPAQPDMATEQSSSGVLFSGSFDIDIESMTIAQYENRQSDFVYNITGFLPDKCPGGCFRFRIVNVIGTVLEIELTIENPLAIQVYDVRIEYTNLFGKTVMNPDSYTDFLGARITTIFPFTAFAKEVGDRAFPVGPGGIDTETLYLDFPPGSPSSVNYSITASLPSNTGEPYEISGMSQIGTLTPSGGNAAISCQVDDHQNNISAVYLNSIPFIGHVAQMLPSAGLFEAEISNTLGAPVGTYNQLIMAMSPNGQNINTYNYVQITVSEDMSDMIYVDDSNTSGIEDGTQANPYNTIQEGVDAAPVNYTVLVDDSGNAYEEQVDMKSNIIVRSGNWDDSDGTGRAFIDGPEAVNTHSVYFYNVTDATIEGFRIGFAGPCDGYDWTQMLRVDGGSGITVEDCLFTGQTDRYKVYPIFVNNASGVEIANCRIASIDRGFSQNGCVSFRGIYAQSCPGLIVRNNVLADIRSTEDEASKEINIIEISGSANVIIKNNLIHHIIPRAGVGYMGAILMKGIYLNNCPGSELANNTIDSMDSSDAYFINQVMAFFIEGSDGVTFTNNIVTHIYSSGFPPPLARGVQAYNCSVVCDFTDIYDIGPGGNGANYFGSASPGVGAISANPLYIDPGNEQYDISDVSPARWGDPSFVDWDDLGPPSNDPGNYDPDTRSRMGCHGGPGGDW
ncbi:right-handed parallel beta-helix repeat-containing protein [bacterium]|nr:right-handed parallel beta-helix repeat-containing protein [bacterium]MBU1025230.1 right-handed parallel beta-helix repeat-containing protein [bacterium]